MLTNSVYCRGCGFSAQRGVRNTCTKAAYLGSFGFNPLHPKLSLFPKVDFCIDDEIKCLVVRRVLFDSELSHAGLWIIIIYELFLPALS